MRRYLVFTALLFCTNFASAQYGAFKADAVTDSLWIDQLLHQHNNAPARESDFDNAKWTHGHVYYSPDSLLRIGQVHGYLGGADFTSTTFSFIYKDSLVVQVLPANFRPGYATLQHIYLPAPHHYLLMSRAPDQFEQTETNTAAVVNLSEGRLGTSVFTSEKDQFEQEDELAFTTLNTGHSSCPLPYFRYDTIRMELDYLVLSEEQSNTGELSINIAVAGTYRYEQGDVFVKTRDSSWYCPSLAQLADTVATKRSMIGKYTITTIVTNELENINGGLFEVRKHEHRIGSIRLSCRSIYSNISEQFPAAKLQANGALVFMTQDLYTYYAPGDCGSCEHLDKIFYYIDKGKAVRVLTIANNTGSGQVEYEFLDAKNELNRGEFAIEDNTRGLEAKIVWSGANTVTARITGSEIGLKTKYSDHRFVFGYANGQPFVKKVK